MSTTITQKKVLGTYGPGSTHWVGDGFPVRNLFPSNGIQLEVSPFLMLDYAGPQYFKPASQPRGVGEHPHRGFETVTIAYQGSVGHRDSAGNSGVIFPGDVQWMTAASGVLHEEMHEAEFTKNGGIFEMIQLWVNLPAANKMSKPGYQAITKEQIPTIDFATGGNARVIAGALNGSQGAAKTFTPLNVWDVNLKAGEQVELPVPEGHNTAIVLRKGDVEVNETGKLSGEARIAVLGSEGDTVALKAEADSNLLLLSGEPINEPIASYGPFVMNTREEIAQAVDDFRNGRFGKL
ncbi:pirin family protein [Edaphobacter sp. 12200R-103]|jgi:redox-sensitive bicupin YhaK (pirin superfamily)|uniref:pirin family protein n=1 Tax=Edaphobacter sp. 12200R-103 TaxID=2703788 RepID=UPI00138BB5F9|nr:pirin family protein [Edaphobacter sp. 12200R-103]QHS52471.1 pirin family protein [Edaphobacter sp. 12200R-103]